MPKDEGLSAAKRSAKTAASEAVSTMTIRKAQKLLDAIVADLQEVQGLLGKVESKAKRGKRTTAK